MEEPKNSDTEFENKLNPEYINDQIKKQYINIDSNNKNHLPNDYNKIKIEFSENKIPLSGDDVLFFYKMGQNTVDKLDRGLI